MRSAPDPIQDRLRAAVVAQRGHFRYESGHHGDLWLDPIYCWSTPLACAS
jgi:hypothetical protein